MNGKINVKNKNLLIGGIILGLVILGGVGYYAYTGFYVHTTAPTEPQVIKIGHVAPLTGFLAAYGDQERQGIDLAVEEINANGGINGKSLVVIHEDDQFDAATATTALNKLITVDKVPAVIGEISSTTTLALAPIAQENKVVLITPLSSSSKLSSAGDYIFQVFPSDTLEAKSITDLATSLNFTNGAILYANSDYGADLEQLVTENFMKNGGTITISEGYSPDTIDFRTQLTKIKEKNPPAIFLLGLGTEMALILKQAKDVGLRSQVFAPNSFYDPRIIDMGGNATEGVIFDYPPSGDPKLWQEFNQKINTKYGYNATMVTAMGYDTMKVLGVAMKNGVTGEDIKTGLYQIKDYPGVTGNITFDKNGDVVSRVLAFKIVHNGRFEEYR